MNAGTELPPWQKVWRIGFAPQLSTAGLQALRIALEIDDPRLIQGADLTPPPLLVNQGCPVEAACALGFCGWHGDGLKTVAQLEEYIARTLFEADQQLGEPADCRWFIHWFDDTPRAQMRAELMIEIDRELFRRGEKR